MRRVARRGLFAAAIALSLSSCLSPTLPLPPPDQPQVDGPDPQTGEVRLRGQVPSRSQIHAMNLRTGDIRGQITGVDGLYDFYIPAAVGDELAMYYRKGTEESQSRVFLIRDPDAE